MFKISLFWQLGPKSAHTKNTIKIGVSATHFLENSFESRNGHFWTNKAQIQKFQLSFFFCAFFFSNNNKKHKNSWNPYFYSVLAELKRENFQNLNLKHRKLKNPIFAPFFRKRLFLENCQIIGNKKTHTHTHTHTHNDNWAKKSPETPIFIVQKWPWPKYWLWLGQNIDFEKGQTWPK